MNEPNQKRGQNILQDPPSKTLLEAFIEQLNDPLIYILLAAGIISILLQEYSDMLIILTIVLVNSAIGVIQEGKAQRALDALKQLTCPHAIVIRDGEQYAIPAKDLIVGDLVYLDAGRQIPADLTLIESVNLQVDESPLTGESIPVAKEMIHKDQLYMCTTVTYGHGIGEVIAIGMDTQMGHIATLLNTHTHEITPLQKRLAELGKLLSYLSLLLCGLFFLIAVTQHRNLIEMLLTAISLAVAAVPEGLPAMVTIVLALSVSRMAKVHTIVKKLPSVETLGSVSVICSDKTGTLTQNKMTVTHCFLSGRNMASHELDIALHKTFLHAITLCNDASIRGTCRIGDPTELALLDLSMQYGITPRSLIPHYPRIQELPFDSNRKCMYTLHRFGTCTPLYVKGSLEEVLNHCNTIEENGQVYTLTSHHRRIIAEGATLYASMALRILAVAYHKNTTQLANEELTFLGLIGMIDPLRPEAKQAIMDCQQAKVATVMITGDRLDTAYAIGQQLHLVTSPSECMSGEELDSLSQEAFLTVLPEKYVFAHVSPAHKVKIVTALQQLGHIVAMTGDGVNDAPSLQAADVGIAMGISGTDVAKNAADLILTDDNFATIAKAIHEGRIIYENIKKSILFLLSSNFGEIMVMLCAILLRLPSPLQSSHILWINLITDSLPALALGMDQTSNQTIMNQPPRSRHEGFFHNGGLTCTIFYGLLIAFITMIAYIQLPLQYLVAHNDTITLTAISKLLQNHALLTSARTYAFTVLGMSQLCHAIGMKDVTQSIFHMNHGKNRLLLLALVVGFLLQVVVTEFPLLITAFGTNHLTIMQWIQLLFLSSTPLIAHELLVILHHINYHIRKNSTP